MISVCGVALISEARRSAREHDLIEQLISEARLLFLLLEFDLVFKQEPANLRSYARKLSILIADAERTFVVPTKNGIDYLDRRTL